MNRFLYIILGTLLVSSCRYEEVKIAAQKAECTEEQEDLVVEIMSSCMFDGSSLWCSANGRNFAIVHVCSSQKMAKARCSKRQERRVYDLLNACLIGGGYTWCFKDGFDSFLEFCGGTT